MIGGKKQVTAKTD